MDARHADGDWNAHGPRDGASSGRRYHRRPRGRAPAPGGPDSAGAPRREDFLERAAASGVSAMNTTLGLGGIATGPDDLRGLLTSIYGYLCYFELEPARVLHILTADDVERAKREGKLGIIFGVQGLASKIDDDLTLLRILHRLGLRVAQLTHNERNPFGCGCLETPDAGLTQLGRACVAELNHLGILVDLAHASPRTAREAIELSPRPSSSPAPTPGPPRQSRNVPDEVLRVLGPGGVLGVTAYAPFCETKPGSVRRSTTSSTTSSTSAISSVSTMSGSAPTSSRASRRSASPASPAATRPRRACTHRPPRYTSRASSGSTDSRGSPRRWCGADSRTRILEDTRGELPARVSPGLGRPAPIPASGAAETGHGGCPECRGFLVVAPHEPHQGPELDGRRSSSALPAAGAPA